MGVTEEDIPTFNHNNNGRGPDARGHNVRFMLEQAAQQEADAAHATETKRSAPSEEDGGSRPPKMARKVEIDTDDYDIVISNRTTDDEYAMVLQKDLQSRFVL